MPKLLLDFFPIVFFFVAYKMYDLYVATAVIIVATLIQVSYSRLKNGKFETMHLVTLALIIVFGGATLILHDEMFIKWKVSVINWLFGLAFIGSQFIGKTPLIKRMMQSAVALPSSIWTRLNAAWGLFFITVGFINLYVVYNFDTETWVNFKLFGMLGLTLAFIILQGIYLSRYMQEDENIDAATDSSKPIKIDTVKKEP